MLAVPSTISPLSSLTLKDAVVAVTTWKSSFASQYTGLNTPAKSATPAISVSFLFAAVSGSAEGSSASISWFVASNEVFVSCDSVFHLFSYCQTHCRKPQVKVPLLPLKGKLMLSFSYFSSLKNIYVDSCIFRFIYSVFHSRITHLLLKMRKQTRIHRPGSYFIITPSFSVSVRTHPSSNGT